MKNMPFFAGLALVALVVTGCGSMSISRIMGNDSPSVQQAQARQDLTMPPDLQLKAPGTVTSEVQQTAVAEPVTRTAAAPQTLGTGNPSQSSQTEGDIYERNGISKVRADGTPKSDSELKAELKKVYLAKKQQQQPNYGTIFNIGNVFKDG